MEDDVVIREGAWRRRAREINKREGETERERKRKRKRERERERVCVGGRETATETASKNVVETEVS